MLLLKVFGPVSDFALYINPVITLHASKGVAQCIVIGLCRA